MNRIVSRIRTPVRREGAESYLLITLLSFGLSVGLTRLFLSLTGYPTLGSGEFHIAHVLWGGLALFVAALLPLIFANRWVYTLGALFAGVGVGLFIDEVGKFITQSNDYFYPPAAPIIYAFFLLTVLLYMQLKRPAPKDPRVELYHALDALEEVLDHDLDPQERADLKARLTFITKRADHPDLARLARELLEFVESQSLHVIAPAPSVWVRLRRRWQGFEASWLTRSRCKATLTGGLLALGLWSAFKLVEILIAIQSPDHLETMIAEMVAVGRVASTTGTGWFAARLALEGATGFLLVLATALLLLGREQRAFGVAYLSLLLSLSAVNLLVFFFDQFTTILLASIQFALLIVLLYYRRNFLETIPEEEAAPEPAAERAGPPEEIPSSGPRP